MSFVLANREVENYKQLQQQSSGIGENRKKDIVRSELGVQHRRSIGEENTSQDFFRYGVWILWVIHEIVLKSN